MGDRAQNGPFTKGGKRIFRIIYEPMKNLLRAILAGIGAKKIGGGKCGCIGTIVVFLILYWLLGYVFEVF